MEDPNTLGFIAFLTALSIGYVTMFGVTKRAMAADATADDRRKLVLSVVTLPVLGIVLTFFHPYYKAGLLFSGFVLAFVMTLNRVTHGIAALTTEPMALGILSVVYQRASFGGTRAKIEQSLAGFGYPLTADDMGFLTMGVAAGVVIGFIPRMLLKSRQLQKAAQPRLNARQIQLAKEKQKKDKSALNAYSRKARKSGALVDRIRSVSSS